MMIFLFNPSELDTLISQFYETDSEMEAVNLLQELVFNSTNSRAAYSIANDVHGDTTFLEYLLNIFFEPHILRIFSNIIHVPTVHNFFFERNMPELIKSILSLNDFFSFDQISKFIKNEENSKIVHELVVFISKLAEKTGDFESYEEMVSYWQTFTLFLMSVVKADNIDDLIDCFNAILLIISKHNDLRLTYLHNDIIYYCFIRFEHNQSDLCYQCDLSLSFFHEN